MLFFFFQAEDGIRDKLVTGVQTCALPICAHAVPPRQKVAILRPGEHPGDRPQVRQRLGAETSSRAGPDVQQRSEEHTSELQSLAYLVCRLLLEKKKKMK